LRDLDGHPANQFLVVGQVVGVHLDEAAIVDDVVDTAALAPVARLGGPSDYAVVRETFRMTRPTV
jgi:flavin reductase (DIM6/NTAB) family NADH-FMN oxidoreductase RutF